jgi:hypothetical protein
MNIIYKGTIQLISAALLLIWLITGSCTKETVNEPYPYNELKTFSVKTAAGDTIPAAISNGNIILYWPYDHVVPDSIAPMITISEHAAVSPADRKSVAVKDSVSYVVTAENGTTSTYKLKFVVNQPALEINDAQSAVGILDGTTSISGITYLIPDVALTSIYLVSEAGVTTQCEINTFEDLGSNDYGVILKTPAVDTGSYKLKVISGGQTITSAKAFVRIIYPYPTVTAVTTAFNVKRGGTFTISGANLRGVVPGRARLTGGTVYYNLELVDFTLTTITYRIPTDFPVGNYNLLHAGFVNYLGATAYLRVGTINPVLIISE